VSGVCARAVETASTLEGSLVWDGTDSLAWGWPGRGYDGSLGLEGCCGLLGVIEGARGSLRKVLRVV
jgi:hypothetical protein